jgi:DNA-binding MarR family transcriptional regulator
MPPPRHPAPGEAVDGLVAVTPLVNRWIERLLAGHEPALTVPQFLALRAVADERLSASELAQRTGVTGPAVSQLLSALANAGLLARSELASDRRRQELALTTTGARALASANALLRERLTELLVELPGPELTALARALPHVEALLAGAPPPRRPPPPPGERPRPPRPR